MHGYSTDSSERRIVPLLVALLAIAWRGPRRNFSPPPTSRSLVGGRPSSMAFYGALYGLFDRYLWRNSFVRKLGLVRIPTSRDAGALPYHSFDGHAKRHDLMINIFQSWTQIVVFLTTATSMSRSCAAVIQVDDPEVLHWSTNMRISHSQTR